MSDVEAVWVSCCSPLAPRYIALRSDGSMAVWWVCGWNWTNKFKGEGVVVDI